MDKQPSGDNSLKCEDGLNESESSIDGLGNTFKKLNCFNKTDDADTCTVTLTPAGDVERCNVDCSTTTLTSAGDVNSCTRDCSTAILTPAGDVDSCTVDCSTAILTPAGDVKSCTRDCSNMNSETDKECSTGQIVYNDVATGTMFNDNQPNARGDKLPYSLDRGDNSSQGSELELNPPYVVTPNDNNDKPGLAIIITGQEFKVGRKRNGANSDIKHMTEVFQQLNFEIRSEPFKNLTTEQLKANLTECAKDPALEHKTCLVIIVSSHGAEVKLDHPNQPDHISDDINVYGHAVKTYDGAVHTTEILNIFDADNCPLMAKNPKLIFIQACRLRNNVKKVDQGHTCKMAVTQNFTKQVESFFRQSSMDYKQEVDQDRAELPVLTETPVLTRIPVLTETPVSTEIPILNDMQVLIEMPVSTEIPVSSETRVSTEKEMLLTPCYENFVVVFSSISEYVGWSEDDGGWLLSAMYDVFMKKIKRKEDIDLLPTMTEVCNKMTEYESNFSDARYDKSMSPLCLLHMLYEEIIFKPVYNMTTYN